MISEIINREFCTKESELHIGWTSSDNILFAEFIRSACKPCNLIELNQSYYGMQNINIIICNNRLMYMDRVSELAKFLHCPILIVDHDLKPNMILKDEQNQFPIKQVYSIATSEDVYLSWNKIQNSILPYKAFDEKNKKLWRDMVFDLSKSNIILNDQ